MYFYLNGCDLALCAWKKTIHRFAKLAVYGIDWKVNPRDIETAI